MGNKKVEEIRGQILERSKKYSREGEATFFDKNEAIKVCNDNADILSELIVGKIPVTILEEAFKDDYKLSSEAMFNFVKNYDEVIGGFYSYCECKKIAVEKMYDNNFLDEAKQNELFDINCLTPYAKEGDEIYSCYVRLPLVFDEKAKNSMLMDALYKLQDNINDFDVCRIKKKAFSKLVERGKLNEKEQLEFFERYRDDVLLLPTIAEISDKICDKAIYNYFEILKSCGVKFHNDMCTILKSVLDRDLLSIEQKFELSICGDEGIEKMVMRHDKTPLQVIEFVVDDKGQRNVSLMAAHIVKYQRGNEIRKTSNRIRACLRPK